jgi:hypothetical protein
MSIGRTTGLIIVGTTTARIDLAGRDDLVPGVLRDRVPGRALADCRSALPNHGHQEPSIARPIFCGCAYQGLATCLEAGASASLSEFPPLPIVPIVPIA